MRHTLSSTLLTIAALCIVTLSCGSNSAHEKETPIRYTKVRVQPVSRADLLTTIQATGTINPVRETYIGPKVGGRIETLQADEGDFVKKGSPLLRLEQMRFKLAVQEARAVHKESLAQLENSEQKLKRKKELYRKGVLDREQLDDMTTEVKLARARLDAAASRLRKAEEDLVDSVLYAPFSGFVVGRTMNRGEFFSGIANEYVFHLVDTSTVEVAANIFETKKRYVATGQKVAVTVDAIPGKTFDGVITVVNPLVDAASRKFLVKIQIANPDFELEAGMFARVEIPEEKRLKTIVVPADAIVERQGEKVVFLAKNLKAVEKKVSTGLTTRTRVEILNGISEGDVIIVDGLYAVKEGTPLQIVDQGGTP